MANIFYLRMTVFSCICGYWTRGDRHVYVLHSLGLTFEVVRFGGWSDLPGVHSSGYAIKDCPVACVRVYMLA